MDDELKSAWRSQAAPPRLTIDATLVLNEVRRNERQFAAMIYCRDVREVAVALLLVPVWIWMGIKMSSLWSWYLTIPTLLWIAGFMVVDRIRQRRRLPGPGETLSSSIEHSLAQVEHQIWLLRNVFWWYLLPPFSTIIFWVIHLAWTANRAGRSRVAGMEAVLGFGTMALFFVLIGWFVYWLNQCAVRKSLEPRRNELRALLKSLEESGEASGR